MDENLFRSLSDIDRHTYQIGALAKVWSTFELGLDLCCLVAYRNLGGNQKYDELPRNLKGKLKLLRRTLSAATDDVALSTNGVSLVDCAAEASVFRHICIHGLSLQEGPDIIIHLLERLPEKYRRDEKKVSSDDMIEAQIEATLLMFGMVRLTLQIFRSAGIVGPFEPPSPLPPELDPLRNSTARAKRIYAAILGLEAR